MQKFEVGDLLVFHYLGWGRKDFKAQKILKITPTGRMKTATFEVNTDLSLRGRRSSMSRPYKVTGMTDAIAAAMQKNKMLDLMKAIKWENIPDAALVDLYNTAKQYDL